MTFSKSLLCLACTVVLPVPLLNAADEIIQTTAATVSTTDAAPLKADATPAFLAPKSDHPFTPLIVGTDLSGWTVHEGKSSAWRREGDTIRCISSTGGWLRSNAVYSDFVLRLEYRIQAGGNTGIGLRAPASGNPTFTGLEIQLLDDGAAKYADLRADQYTGSIYYQVAASKKAKLQPVNEWNQCEICCLGDEVTVRINGEIVNQVRLNDRQQEKNSQGVHLLSQRPPIGHLALQSHSTQVDFRKIEVQDLAVHAASGLNYVDLVAGTGESVGDAASVTLHYVGQLENGKRFTDTRDLGAPVQVPLHGLISGLQEGIQGMKVGGRRRMVIPPQLAYGEAGVNDSIPGNATLVFEVEIREITRN